RLLKLRFFTRHGELLLFLFPRPARSSEIKMAGEKRFASRTPVSESDIRIKRPNHWIGVGHCNLRGVAAPNQIRILAPGPGSGFLFFHSAVPGKVSGFPRLCAQ